MSRVSAASEVVDGPLGVFGSFLSSAGVVGDEDHGNMGVDAMKTSQVADFRDFSSCNQCHYSYSLHTPVGGHGNASTRLPSPCASSAAGGERRGVGAAHVRSSQVLVDPDLRGWPLGSFGSGCAVTERKLGRLDVLCL